MNIVPSALNCAIGSLPLAEALDRVLALVTAPLRNMCVPVETCAGRILAQAVHARIDLPGFDQSAMDGYAVRSIDVTADAFLPVTGRTAAGEPPGCLAPGDAHRVLTGAPLPAGADAVIPQESVRRDGDFIAIGGETRAGMNLRRRGEDILAGIPLVPAGAALDWRHITMLAAQGIGSVAVRQRPRVALLSTGRELRRAGDSLAPGQIHDSNLPMLTALLSVWNAEVRQLPLVADSAAAVQAGLEDAASGADLILTTAGISVGDEDHVREALRNLGGTLAVVTVAMKPGKPLAAGRLGEAVFLGLPGNPQAALAGAIAFVRPLLAKLTGTSPPSPLCARAGFSLPRRPGRTEFLPVRLLQRGACLCAEPAGLEGSGRLSPLLVADGLAMLPATAGELKKGDVIFVHPFRPGYFSVDGIHP